MAYLPHLRATFRGTMPGNEIFATTLNFASALDAPFTLSEVQEVAPDLAALYETFHESVKGQMSVGCIFTRCDTYAVGTNGKALFQGSATLATPAVGNGSITLPNQCSMVMSLRTNRAGRAYRGRMYLPTLNVGGGLGADGRLTANIASDLADQFVIFLNAANNVVAGTTPIQAVVSSGVGLGANTAITQLSVGRVIDTQRRRRSNLEEAPYTLTVNP